METQGKLVLVGLVGLLSQLNCVRGAISFKKRQVGVQTFDESIVECIGTVQHTERAHRLAKPVDDVDALLDLDLVQTSIGMIRHAMVVILRRHRMKLQEDRGRAIRLSRSMNSANIWAQSCVSQPACGSTKSPAKSRGNVHQESNRSPSKHVIRLEQRIEQLKARNVCRKNGWPSNDPSTYSFRRPHDR